MWNLKGALLDETGHPDTAIEAYDRALGINGGHEEALNQQGRRALLDGQAPRRHRRVRARGAGEPPQQVHVEQHGHSLRRPRHADRAIECYEQALQLQPKDRLLWNNLGTLLYRVGRTEDAIRCYNKALEVDATFAQAWNNRGAAFEALGRVDEALYCYDKCIELAPRERERVAQPGRAAAQARPPPGGGRVHRQRRDARG